MQVRDEQSADPHAARGKRRAERSVAICHRFALLRLIAGVRPRLAQGLDSPACRGELGMTERVLGMLPDSGNLGLRVTNLY
jgi:hypothetical protein